MNRWRYVFIGMWFLLGIFFIYRVFADDITLTTIMPGGSGGWTVSGSDIYATNTISPLTGSVGIGTTSPNEKLTIGDGTNKRLHFSSSTTPSNPLAGSLVIYTDGTDLLVKNSGGAFR